MPAPDPAQVAAWIVAAVAGGAAAFERIRNAKHARQREESADLVSDAKAQAERAEMHAKLADEYKRLFEKEHAELQAYRDYVHDKQQKDQALLAASQERIQELQARPDFSDLFEHLKSQSDVSVKILAGMERQQEGTKEILSAIKTLVERSHPITPSPP